MGLSRDRGNQSFTQGILTSPTHQAFQPAAGDAMHVTGWHGAIDLHRGQTGERQTSQRVTQAAMTTRALRQPHCAIHVHVAFKFCKLVHSTIGTRNSTYMYTSFRTCACTVHNLQLHAAECEKQVFGA